MLYEKLTENGSMVVCAKDGEKGLEMTKKEKPGLILLDSKIPKIDGMTYI